MTVATTDISGPVQRERVVLAGLESKLSDALDRRDKTINEISRASADAAASFNNSGRAPGQPRVIKSPASLDPLNKRATAIDAEIALLRMQISGARRAVELAESAAKARSTSENSAVETGRLIQLEIRAPEGRVLRQWHRCADTARKALQPGYEVIGEVIGGNVVSPIGPGARPFMKALLDAQGDVLMEWLAEQGIVGSDKTVVVLPSNGRENMQ